MGLFEHTAMLRTRDGVICKGFLGEAGWADSVGINEKEMNWSVYEIQMDLFQSRPF